MRDKDSAYLRLYAARQVPSPTLDREHRRILDACAANDEEAAEAAVREHLGGTVEHVTRLLRGGAPGREAMPPPAFDDLSDPPPPEE